MSQDRTLSMVAGVVGAVSAIWYFHDVARATASRTDVHFPLVPALVAGPAILLALYLGTRDRSEE